MRKILSAFIVEPERWHVPKVTGKYLFLIHMAYLSNGHPVCLVLGAAVNRKRKRRRLLLSTLDVMIKSQVDSVVACVIPGHYKLLGFFIPLSRYFLHIDPQYDLVD